MNFQTKENRGVMSPQDKLIAQFGDFGQMLGGIIVGYLTDTILNGKR